MHKKEVISRRAPHSYAFYRASRRLARIGSVERCSGITIFLKIVMPLTVRNEKKNGRDHLGIHP
ncbi:hypothetical protein HII30_11080 [Paenibacillus lemnae]|uniref:Uncharacterized protein n=1 Tax=Paenibacillus lemnae TaxID=1330551 RepID=A0A848MA01_PAELE|nr:hypothetical protein [Paenibacillus lemnae]